MSPDQYVESIGTSLTTEVNKGIDFGVGVTTLVFTLFALVSVLSFLVNYYRS